MVVGFGRAFGCLNLQFETNPELKRRVKAAHSRDLGMRLPPVMLYSIHDGKKPHSGVCFTNMHMVRGFSVTS